jgi:hypothetical protein
MQQNIEELKKQLVNIEGQIAYLEEQKKLDEEQKTIKKSNPLNIFKNIIDKKKNQIDNNSYSKSIPLARFYDQEKLEMMEPIFNMFINIQDRLEKLEKKN